MLSALSELDFTLVICDQSDSMNKLRALTQQVRHAGGGQTDGDHAMLNLAGEVHGHDYHHTRDDQPGSSLTPRRWWRAVPWWQVLAVVGFTICLALW